MELPLPESERNQKEQVWTWRDREPWLWAQEACDVSQTLSGNVRRKLDRRL